jgi:hypothetical protein
MSVVDIGKWRQGVLFSAPQVSVVWNALSDENPPNIITKSRKPRSGEKFVIISQTCDIKAKKEDEPYVEALLCTKEKKTSYLARIDRNSARKFVIGPDVNLIAEAKYRVLLDKDVLSVLTPEAWYGTTERFGRFVRWLARRFDRPALPDVMVETFQVPIENILKQIDDNYPSIGIAFSQAVYEMRVNVPEHEDPPYHLNLLMMGKQDSLSIEEADAIDYVFNTILHGLDSTIIHLDPDKRFLTDEEISLAEHRATRPMFLEYHTYKGEEIEGAEPFGRS